MNGEYLDRESAPFGPEVWTRLDETVIAAASTQMSARRLIETEGPHGLGTTSVPGPEEEVLLDGEGQVTMTKLIALPTLRQSFTLPTQAVAAFEHKGASLSLRNATLAAIAVARREDDVVFNGILSCGTPGLLNFSGIASIGLGSWDDLGNAFENVVQAVNVLDERGLHGPYALGLGPGLYNSLFRVYPNAGITEYQQLSQLITGGIVKSPALGNSGVLMAVGKHYVSLIIGQDLVTSYVGPICGGFEFCIMESIGLRLSLPDAVCVIGGQ